MYQSSFVVSLYETSPLSSKGRVIIFYGNKSSSPLLGFSTTTNTADHEGMLEINLQQMPTTVDAGAQQQQVINVDCKNVFFEAPHLEIKFK